MGYERIMDDGDPVEIDSVVPRDAPSTATDAGGGVPAEIVVTRPFAARLCQFFTMRDRLDRAGLQAFDERHPGWPDYCLGAIALADARQLGGSAEGKRSAILLLRSAIVLLTLARLAREKKSIEADDHDAWARLAAVAGVSSHLERLNDDARNIVKGALGASRGEAYLARLDERELEPALAVLCDLAQVLAGPLGIQASEVRRLVFVRRFRTGVAAFALFSGLLWAWAKVSAETNLALDKAVTVATRSAKYRTDPKHVVDGDRHNLGFHSEDATDQSVTIDLGAVRRLHRVDVYNRADCCQERAVPIVLQLSNDGRSYREVLRQTKEFEVWRASVTPTNARYVRLLHPTRGVFHLSEIEVY